MEAYVDHVTVSFVLLFFIYGNWLSSISSLFTLPPSSSKTRDHNFKKES